MKTIDFLKTLQQPSGAFLGWPQGPIYPEITGYLIPTLCIYDEISMARRAAEFLLETQNPDGSWNSVHGEPAVFDTSAVIEGLKYINLPNSAEQVIKAIEWVKSQKLLELYHVRSMGIVGYPFIGSLSYTFTTRVHYFAYALEGLFMMDRFDEVMKGLSVLRRGLQPRTMDGIGSDTCATAQVAFLRMLVGMNASQEVEAVTRLLNEDGSLPHDLENPKKVSWACKYFLDMQYLMT